ncbi:MAG: P-type conjugative transfer protein TrbJ [Brevundimonas sp.]|jgi:P-type conjugative transfer protein TrbJ|uniref:conjugal transfer protein TrbJ n=1 Tax=Brevundimonas sp. TaxID=1871086 RepID=UPI0039E3500E
MWTRSLKPLTPPDRRRSAALSIFAAASILAAGGAASAQHVVFDPRNHVENALQSARQLESLANEAAQLANEARMLAASPYSHLVQSSETLARMQALAGSVTGMASGVEDLQQQFDQLYASDLTGLGPRALAGQRQERAETARRTAQDLALAAAELDRLAAGRAQRVHGALSASETANGQTAAVQSSTQMLAVLAEDLASMRIVLAAEARLMAETAARQAAERAAAAEARRRFWSGGDASPAPPAFDPFPRARD